MGNPRSGVLLASLRAELGVDVPRHLVAVADAAERQRIAVALVDEGRVHEVASRDEALARARSESLDLVFVEGDDPRLVGEVAKLGGKVDLIPVVAADPGACGDAFCAGAVALLPRPLPDNDGRLRAHLQWLASCRRSRRRARLWRQLVAQHGPVVEAAPGLAEALAELERDEGLKIDVLLLSGQAARLTPYFVPVAAELRLVESQPDVVVVELAPGDAIDARLREARTRAAGAAVLILDRAPSAARVHAALYGGVRACLTEAQVERLGALAVTIGLRRRAESVGRRLVETLARFGALDAADPAHPPAAAKVDARLISEVAASSASFVPSGHEVLVVDDEPVVATVLREALRRGGYKVTTAASAEEALALFGKQRFDLVLTDKNLPGASGLEVLRAARALDPPPAVVLITGYSSYDSAIEAFEVGALDYIEKPIKDLENLRQRVRRALSRRDEQLAQAPLAASGPQPHVLLVEAEGARRELMAEFLGKNYLVTTVADGDEALARLQSERFDVVLADRNLPGLSGLRVIEQARRLLPHSAAVLYTAYPSYETVKEAFDLGVDAFCVRPSEDLKALAEKVAGALRSRGGILLG